MATITTERPSLKVVRQYQTTPAQVWQAWTSAEALKQWMGPAGVKCLDAEADVRVGGRYRILMKSPDGQEHDVRGVYREIQPNRKLVFSCSWERTHERESLVTIELRPIDTGTELTLTHEQFVDESERDHHRQGWDGCLDSLERFITARRARS